jgi:hypothetical protein
MATRVEKETDFRRGMYRRAAILAFIKLDPRSMVRNPVMFVTEVGSVIGTALWIQALFGHGEASSAFIGEIALWLWMCVLFANFSEAIAEDRGKAQAAALRRARRETQARSSSRLPSTTFFGYLSPMPAKCSPIGTCSGRSGAPNSVMSYTCCTSISAIYAARSNRNRPAHVSLSRNQGWAIASGASSGWLLAWSTVVRTYQLDVRRF